MCWFTRTTLFKKKSTGSYYAHKKPDLIRKTSLFSENWKLSKIFNLEHTILNLLNIHTQIMLSLLEKY